MRTVVGAQGLYIGITTSSTRQGVREHAAEPLCKPALGVHLDAIGMARCSPVCARLVDVQALVEPGGIRQLEISILKIADGQLYTHGKHQCNTARRMNRALQTTRYSGHLSTWNGRYEVRRLMGQAECVEEAYVSPRLEVRGQARVDADLGRPQRPEHVHADARSDRVPGRGRYVHLGEGSQRLVGASREQRFVDDSLRGCGFDFELVGILDDIEAGAKADFGDRPMLDMGAPCQHPI